MALPSPAGGLDDEHIVSCASRSVLPQPLRRRRTPNAASIDFAVMRNGARIGTDHIKSGTTAPKPRSKTTRMWRWASAS